jgi:hypothetical protein
VLKVLLVRPLGLGKRIAIFGIQSTAAQVRIPFVDRECLLMLSPNQGRMEWMSPQEACEM